MSTTPDLLTQSRTAKAYRDAQKARVELMPVNPDGLSFSGFVHAMNQKFPNGYVKAGDGYLWEDGTLAIQYLSCTLDGICLSSAFAHRTPPQDPHKRLKLQRDYWVLKLRTLEEEHSQCKRHIAGWGSSADPNARKQLAELSTLIAKCREKLAEMDRPPAESPYAS